ncbi:hypothetical protein [Streptomyces sp. NPDC029674]|uniref:hypothetical protein n=1 Tax=Streptomyces sp. NPDC029674 TaxID=3365297 RepID=UPI00384C5F63
MPRQTVAEQYVDLLARAGVRRRGVSVVSLPGDVAGEHSPAGGAELAMPLDRPAIRPADHDLTRLVELVGAATPGVGRMAHLARANIRNMPRP